MSAAKTCLAGLVLFSLTAAACTSDDATEARGETLGADLAEAEIALAEVQADLAAAIETADELAENLAAVQAQLGEKEQLLASRTQELEAARDELAGARAEAADLSAVLWQLRASATLVCPLPSAGLPYQALPLAVAETRARIHAAAVNCNWL